MLFLNIHTGLQTKGVSSKLDSLALLPLFIPVPKKQFNFHVLQTLTWQLQEKHNVQQQPLTHT